jgi:hypothetical protein
VGSSQLTPNAAFSSRAHIPTGRVSLESVIELLIQDFGVVPLSADWPATLATSRSHLHQWRSWS